MKYVSFLNNKKESFGILLDQKIVDLTMHTMSSIGKVWNGYHALNPLSKIIKLAI